MKNVLLFVIHSWSGASLAPVRTAGYIRPRQCHSDYLACLGGTFAAGEPGCACDAFPDDMTDRPQRRGSCRGGWRPRRYMLELCVEKCDLVYQYFFEPYMGHRQSVYARN